MFVPGAQAEIWTVGANYNGSFDAIDVSASLGYTNSGPETDSVAGTGLPIPGIEDRDAWVAGLTFSWDAWAVGAAYKFDDQGGGTGVTGDLNVLDIGFTYTTGPWVLGFNYGHLEQETLVPATGADIGDDELDGYAFTMTYSMGPGISMVGALKYYDYDSDFIATATPSGAIVVLGMVTSF